MALSDRDYIARRKKKHRPGSRRRGGRGQTWMGVNRNFVLGALIVIGLCVLVYVLQAVRP